MKLSYPLASMIVMITETGSTQTHKPFPQNVNYPFGFKPDTITSLEAQTAYRKWKELYLVQCKNGYRVTCESPDETRVEAIGFGMILTAYFGDRKEFDGLFSFYQSKRTTNANNMMAWNVSCDGINDPGSASDGDIDVAFALIVAHNQWGADYLLRSREVIQTIKNSVVFKCDGLFALAPGFSERIGGLWGGCDLTDIQYYTPAFFRIFAEVSGDNDWNTLADDSYTILNAGAHPITGLVPDWQSVSGNPGGNSYRISYYCYDACRVPWRMALDYLWNGNEQSKHWCAKVSEWAYHIGPANIKDGYNLDGTENSQGYHNSAFAGGFAVAAMCNSQTIADAFGVEMMNNQLTDDSWFILSTRSLYLLSITGNFWRPIVTSDR